MKSWLLLGKFCISIGFEGIYYHHSHNTNLLTLSSRYRDFREPCLHLQSAMVSELPAISHQDFFLRCRLCVLTKPIR